MRNRAGINIKSEDAFINAGTASPSVSAEHLANSSSPELKQSKAKPISISFSHEILEKIDEIIVREMKGGNVRVNRSDVVRAGIIALQQLPATAVSELIQKSKLK